MFTNTIQPSVISLFSSTGSSPLEIFSTHTDSSLPADSFIHLLNDATSQPLPASPNTLITPSAINPAGDPENENAENEGHTLCQTVLHIQSPTLRRTFVRCPPVREAENIGTTASNALSQNLHSGASSALGIKHSWMRLQVRNLGKEWSFEVGVVDQHGHAGVIRCSTFQKQPTLKIRHTPPLLHLPLSFPSATSRPLTTWSTITLDLASLTAHFGALRPDEDEEGSDSQAVQRQPLPSSRFSYVSYVKVYATCRLRRIWFSEQKPSEQVPWELQLYAASP